MSTLATTTAILAFLILAFITSIPLLENFKSYSPFKRIYTTTAVVLLFILGSFDVYFKATDPTELSKISADINRIATFLGLRNKVQFQKKDSTKKVIALAPKLNIAKKQIPFALLRLSETPEFRNPQIIKTKANDSILIYLTNLGTGEAFKIKANCFFIRIYNGNIMLQDKLHPFKTNKFFSILPKETTKISSAYYVYKDTVQENEFYCMKFNYTDNTNRQKTLQKILILNKDLTFGDSSDEDFNTIQLFLDKNKKW